MERSNVGNAFLILSFPFYQRFFEKTSLVEVLVVGKGDVGPGRTRFHEGAEFGQITSDVPLARRLYEDPRVDIILASVHEMHDLPDFYFLDYGKIDIKRLIDDYFEEALRTASLDCFDVFAHLTYGLRYMPNREQFDLTPYDSVLDDILRTLAINGKALELNGSGLKKKIPYTDPDFRIVKRFRELGGQYLTISTDAHESAFLGYRLDELEDMARAAGFDALTYYRRHEPIPMPL